MNVIYLVLFAVIASMMLLIFRALLKDLHKDLMKHAHGRKGEDHPKKGKSGFRVIR